MPRGYRKIPLHTTSSREEAVNGSLALIGSPATPKQTSSRPKRAVRLRKLHKKTRTGCYTCRVRRVKCDEARPACSRCAKFGWDCEGYPSDVGTSTTPPVNGAGRKLISKSTPTPGLGTTRIRPGPKFSDELQGLYFRYYCEEIAAQIKGPHVTSLWERIVPQSGEAEPFIVHAIVALGALSKSQTTHWLRGSSQHSSIMDSHHQYALLQYGKALQGMRRAIENQTQDRRKALIACLLVFCFECLLGRQTAASSYASSGVRLLYSCHADTSSPSSLAEDDIYSAFSGLDLQSLILVNTQSLATHQTLKDDINVVLRLMPETFTKLKECRMFWQLIMRRNLHFLATANAQLRAWDFLKEDAAESECLNLKNSNNPCGVSYTAPTNIPPELLQEQDHCLADIRRWELASAALFSPVNIGYEDQIVTKLMQLHAAMTVIMVENLFHQVQPPELFYDDYLPEFSTIVNLCSSIKEILGHCVWPFPCTSFRFDIGVIPALAATGSNCRDRKVRSQAIDLLLGSPAYQEGVWDAVSIGTICDWKRRIEEEFLDENGYIPGNRRATMSKVELNLQERMADVAAKQWIGDGVDDFVIREKILRW